MDWMTLAIEACGVVIFCLWVIIPIREYRAIYQRLLQRDQIPLADEARGEGPAFEVIARTDPPTAQNHNAAGGEGRE